MKGNSILTKQQKLFYEENGYILIKNNICPEFLDEMKQRFINICNNTTEFDVGIIMQDQSLKSKGAKGEYLINKIQDFAFDEVLSKYANHEDILDVVESLIGPNITVIHSMVINKPPNAEAGSSLHPLHQDLHYFPFRPADKIVGSWTAIERVDESNGCLYIIPGSHTGSLYKHTYPESTKKKFYHGVEGFEHLPRKYIIMEKGDTVFFHPLLLHGSGPNRTKGFRKAISCHYADSNCHCVDVKDTVQENIAKEIEALIEKRGTKISFQEVFKLKSRLVRGEPGLIQKIESNL